MPAQKSTARPVGRPRLTPQGIAKRVNVTLDEVTIRLAKSLGRKNLSRGIRLAVARVYNPEK